MEEGKKKERKTESAKKALTKKGKNGGSKVNAFFLVF